MFIGMFLGMGMVICVGVVRVLLFRLSLKLFRKVKFCGICIGSVLVLMWLREMVCGVFMVLGVMVSVMVLGLLLVVMVLLRVFIVVLLMLGVCMCIGMWNLVLL